MQNGMVCISRGDLDSSSTGIGAAIQMFATSEFDNVWPISHKNAGRLVRQQNHFPK